MILTHLVMFKFFSGAGDASAVVPGGDLQNHHTGVSVGVGT